MIDREKHVGLRIPWPVTAVPLIFLCALYFFGILFGWRFYKPIIRNAIALNPNTPLPLPHITTHTSTPTNTPVSINTAAFRLNSTPTRIKRMPSFPPANTLFPSIDALTPTNILVIPPTDTSAPTKVVTPTNTLISSNNSLTPTPRSLGETATATQHGMNVITLTGITNVIYSPEIPNNTLIDATSWTSTAIGPAPEGTTRKAVDIYGTNNSAGGAYITWRGGVIVGSIPQSWSWRTTHEFGGGGIFLRNNGPVEWQFIRIHNVEDGIKPREAPEYSNTGSWILRDCYFTAIRDDSIENDRFEPGTVQDCLFDGVFAFISEQDENVGNNTPIGPNENNTIYINRVYVRLYGTNDAEGPGKWFKWQGNVQHHRLAISDSVFAIGAEPVSGWSSKIIPPEVSWEGNNNFILWLGTPGAYGGPMPAGVTFLEGEAAQNKWISVRNKWLTDHGLPSQDFPADYNPHYAPVMQIPVGF